MIRDVILRGKADAELAEAALWYEDRSPGLGSEFLLCVEAVLNSVMRNAEMYPVIQQDVRRALVRRFPYAVFFVIEEARIVVLGVLHARRHPRHWRSRR